MGDLKVVVTLDIGNLGPVEGAAITYYWNPLYNLTGVLPWLLIVLGIILLKENRSGQVLWILVPIVLFRLGWAGFTALQSIPSEASVLFVMLIDCLLIGFVMNWLLGERIGKRNRFVTWLLALAVFAVVFGVMILDSGFSLEVIQVSILVGLTVGILLFSFVFAGVICRKKLRPIRFSLWLALWILICTTAFITAFAAIQVAFSPYTSFSEIAVQVIVVCLVYSGILIGGLLPFEIVLFVCPFWRKRFEAVMGMPTRAAAVEHNEPEYNPVSG